MSEHVSTSHIGYLCDARKVAVVRGVTSTRFCVENMAIIDSSPLSAGHATFKPVLEGEIQRVETAMGVHGWCDFSAVTTPGVYRVVLQESGERSFQFTIADGVYHKLPYLFLDYVREQRSGYYESDLRRPTHLDDGVRSDNGEPLDTVGGWYDAGDMRKWMGHSTLPALGMFDIEQRLKLRRRAFDEPGAFHTDWLTEAAWGLNLIFKMQDPTTGMIYEDVGGGSTARFREGMSWWYENHAGCYADNFDNRFTDSIPGTGDERSVRIQYNPVAQYTNLTILARAYSTYAPYNAMLAGKCHRAMIALWNYCQTRLNDEEHTWTFIRAWRLIAALEIQRAGYGSDEAVETALDALIETFDEVFGFWVRSTTDAEPYRGIIHAAQPVIALARYLDYLPNGASAERVRAVLARCKAGYIDPMTATNPYRFMPFGVYSQPATEGELYRPYENGRFFRFAMPVNSVQQINHGLAGHWMSWAHALVYAGDVLGDRAWRDLAWAQIDWLLGNNEYDVSFVSGVGYNNPMPHSRMMGTLIGGFMNGFRGSADDLPAVDLERDAEWNSTEYWNTPLSNCWMALSCLLPPIVPTARKLGLP